MKNNRVYFTAGEFAKLHHMNKRTLHYYDEIGLFSPKHKGENSYRYYTFEQSMELENILALRELDMSIEEIKSYSQNPNPTDFLKISTSKIEDIDKTIAHLKKIKSVFLQKQKMLKDCAEVYDGKIEIVHLKEEYLLMTPLALNFESEDYFIQNSHAIMDHLQAAWNLCTYKKSCGSYISLEKVKYNQFETYDGIFTVLDTKKRNLCLKPKGSYIRGFSIGDWDKLPSLYEKMLLFAKENNLTLTGNAFERGMNEFAILDMEDYITQIEIQCILK